MKRLPFVVCCVVFRVRRSFFLLSLSFGFSFLGVFSLAGSGRSFFLLLGFVARSMLLGSVLRGFIFCWNLFFPSMILVFSRRLASFKDFQYRLREKTIYLLLDQFEAINR